MAAQRGAHILACYNACSIIIPLLSRQIKADEISPTSYPWIHVSRLLHTHEYRIGIGAAAHDLRHRHRHRHRVDQSSVRRAGLIPRYKTIRARAAVTIPLSYCGAFNSDCHKSKIRRNVTPTLLGNHFLNNNMYRPRFIVPAAILSVLAFVMHLINLVTLFLFFGKLWILGNVVIQFLGTLGLLMNVSLLCKPDKGIHITVLWANVTCSWLLAVLHVTEALMLNQREVPGCIHAVLCEIRFYRFTDAIAASCWILAGLILAIAKCGTRPSGAAAETLQTKSTKHDMKIDMFDDKSDETVSSFKKEGLASVEDCV